jgi:hypothetical protein
VPITGADGPDERQAERLVPLGRHPEAAGGVCGSAFRVPD